MFIFTEKLTTTNLRVLQPRGRICDFLNIVCTQDKIVDSTGPSDSAEKGQCGFCKPPNPQLFPNVD